MFEKASRLKLRFSSDVGNIATEDLWDLNLKQLNTIAKNLNKKLKDAEEEDFLEEKSAEDTKLKLSFDIVLHVLKTKKDELEKRKNAAEKREQQQKLMGILSKKQDASLEKLSEEEIQKKIAELD